MFSNKAMIIFYYIFFISISLCQNVLAEDKTCTIIITAIQSEGYVSGRIYLSKKHEWEEAG